MSPSRLRTGIRADADAPYQSRVPQERNSPPDSAEEIQLGQTGMLNRRNGDMLTVHHDGKGFGIDLDVRRKTVADHALLGQTAYAVHGLYVTLQTELFAYAAIHGRL